MLKGFRKKIFILKHTSCALGCIDLDAEKVSPCCVAVSRNMENVTITGYRLQEKNLPCIKAVM